MSDKFISPKPLPTAHEREILTMLIEECAEIQQRATKLIRFGRDEIQEGQDLTNAQRLADEILDFMLVLGFVKELNLVDYAPFLEDMHRRHQKKLKYIQSKRDDI
jgi:NTP pyrophosphatase (non-canonical NTP hydrolase)